MPTTLPVPSKGALRALRQLALGTSCTIAIGAGLLTEDRRRRIHSAREVHDNAKRLKSSRQYHSAGTTSLEALEGQAQRYRDEAFWLPSNVLKSTASAVLDHSGTANAPKIQLPVEEDHISKPPGIPKYTPKPPEICRTQKRLVRRPLAARTSQVVEYPTQRSHDRHHRIASYVTKFLKQDPPDVEVAARLFFEGLEEEEHLDKSGMSRVLIDASIRLSQACQSLFLHDTSSRILKTVLSYGPMAEEDFHEFHPSYTIRWLLKNGDNSSPDPDNLREACSIFLTKFVESPRSMSPEMRRLGERLCQETCQQGMFDLTLALFTRLEKCRAEKQPLAVNHLIKATHGIGHHKKMFRHFQKLFTQTNPDQLQFFQTTGLVIDSMLLLGKLDEAEQILVSASEMAEAGGLETSTTWFLRVLREEHMSHRDLVRSQALFRRLLPRSSRAKHPQALYGAMIQFSVEAREEELAMSIYSELREIHEPCTEDLRIYGHFALAKAYRGDWDGVKESFRSMKQTVPGEEDTYSMMFGPILKEFVQSHAVDEIEDFIRYFLVTFHLKTTSVIMNIMINVYSKIHEVDAIARWVEYATTDGCTVTSKTFNTVLRNCVSTFQFNFEECRWLYCKVRKLNLDLVDNDSLSILRALAMRSRNEGTRSHFLQLINQYEDSVGISNSNEVYRAMTTTFAENDYVAVLKVYQRAVRDDLRLEPKHLIIAVRASLNLHGEDVAEAAKLIRDAQANGLDTISAVAQVFIHQMSDLRENGSQVGRLNELAERTISSFEARGTKVPQSAIAHTASVLQRRGRSRMAIDFWDLMSRRLNIPASAFDLASITTLLQAYIATRDGDGIRWTLKILSANKISPDVQFKATLKEARKEAGKRLVGHMYSERLHGWWEVLDEAHREVVEMRKQALITKPQVRFKVFNIMETALEADSRRTATLEGRTGQGQDNQHSQERGDSNAYQAEGKWVESEDGSDGTKRMVAAI